MRHLGVLAAIVLSLGTVPVGSALPGMPGSVAYGAPSVDLWVLTDVLCHQIEPNLKAAHPQWSVGDGGTSLGQCQIQYRTAVGIGGLDERIEGFPVLGDVKRSKVIAHNILVWCGQDQFVVDKKTGKSRKIHEARFTVMGLGACYNGPDMAYPSLARIAMICGVAVEEDDPGLRWKAEKRCKAYRSLRAYAERVDVAFKKTLVAQK